MSVNLDDLEAQYHQQYSDQPTLRCQDAYSKITTEYRRLGYENPDPSTGIMPFSCKDNKYTRANLKSLAENGIYVKGFSGTYTTDGLYYPAGTLDPTPTSPPTYSSFDAAAAAITSPTQAVKETITTATPNQWEIVALSIGNKYAVINNTKLFSEKGEHFKEGNEIESESGSYIWTGNNSHHYLFARSSALSLLSEDPDSAEAMVNSPASNFPSLPSVPTDGLWYITTLTSGDQYNHVYGLYKQKVLQNGKYRWNSSSNVYPTQNEASSDITSSDQAVKEVKGGWALATLTVGKGYSLEDGIKVYNEKGEHFKEDGEVYSESGVYVWTGDDSHDYIRAKTKDGQERHWALTLLSEDPRDADALVKTSVANIDVWYITTLQKGDKYSLIYGMYKQKISTGTHTWKNTNN